MDTTRSTLLERVKNRSDDEAWQEFDAIYRPLLRRFASARGLTHADADDVVQHCLVTISRHIGDFDYDPRRGKFKAWLRTIINNRIRNLARGQRDYSAGSHDFDRLSNREATPEALFDRLWREEHLRHCLNRVTSEVDESTFKAFRAYVLEEQPVEQVCRAHNMTRNQVQLIKWRVTNKLRQHMKILLGDSA